MAGNGKDHHIITILFLSLVILCFAGVGNVYIVGTVGIFLCIFGCTQGEAVVDFWVLIPLLIFDLIGLLSSLVTYGTIAEGFARTQTIFTVIYLLMSYLKEEERDTLRCLCVSWVGFMAAVGILQFIHKTMARGAVRAGGILGGANAFGICLVIGWFALLNCSREEKERDFQTRFPECLEPLILAALALTLSMGSFVSMAIGILALFFYKKKKNPWKPAGIFVCQLLARASVGIGLGILMYIASRKTDLPWLSILIFMYLLAAAWYWKKFLCFLKDFPRRAAVASGMGVIVAAVAVISRPSAAATFAERLRMMKNGLGYIWVDPLLGVGANQWRVMNLYDSDIYYNTWHIHNMFINIGVELGLVAMAMLIVVAFRHFMKKGDDELKSGSAAFLFHNLMDVGFFYEAIPVLVLLTVSRPQKEGKRVKAVTVKALFVLCAVVFAYSLAYNLFHL